jgi:exosortase
LNHPKQGCHASQSDYNPTHLREWLLGSDLVVRSMTVAKSERPSALEEFTREFATVWKSIPYKGLFVFLLVPWVLLFEFVGNSTFGYLKSHSLYAWMFWDYLSNPDDEHGLYIPLVILALFWWKRDDFRNLKAAPWLPGLILVAVAVVLHLAGYIMQQTRVSIAAFFLGLYALIAVVWGFRAMLTSFFPMCLLAFALPLGTLAEAITFPLRLFATTVTGSIAQTVLGINVIYKGTMIYDPSGAFQYEVAAACGGLRSLTAVLALSTIFGFMNFKRVRNRFILVLAGIPLAILANMSRLLGLIIISEGFGQEIGMKAHDSAWFSMLPYVPAIVGVVLLGHWLRERPASSDVERPMIQNSTPVQATP